MVLYWNSPARRVMKMALIGLRSGNGVDGVYSIPKWKRAVPMPQLSQEERSRREQAVDLARADVELSGGRLSPEAERLNKRYLAGELSDSEHVDALLAHGRLLPAGEPMRGYYTSFNEATKADPARWSHRSG